jgi:hypothetical protein
VILARAGAIALCAFAMPQPAAAQTVQSGANHQNAAASNPGATLSLDTPIVDLVANPKANAVLIRDLGNDMSKHPAYDQFKGMSLKQIASYSNGAISEDVLQRIAADLAAIR